MQLKRDFLIGVGILILLNVLLAFGAIGLLTRMSPAIGKILEENVESNRAGEVMLARLTEVESGVQLGAEAQSSFRDSLARAKRNITEVEEVPVLNRIEELAGAAFEGDPKAVALITENVLRLSRINRAAMMEVDLEAQRLGTAGAWAAAFLSLISLVISLLVIGRLEKQLVSPLMELNRVLQAHRNGDVHRRCYGLNLSREIRSIFDALNEVLDRTGEAGKTGGDRKDTLDKLQRVALVRFLDQYGKAAVIIDRTGQIGASSRQALLTLSDPEGEAFRNSLRELASSGTAPAGLEAIRLEEQGWVAIRKRTA